MQLRASRARRTVANRGAIRSLRAYMRPPHAGPVVAGDGTLKVGITAQRFGDWWESFRYIPAVQERIRRIDSGATVELLTYNHEFLRFFMAPSATREALKTCRHVIAMDGTFLIRAQKATLLYANAMDGNQQIIPIAWALVESETKDTWTWFCRLFDKHCSDWKGRDDAAIISDRDKGPIPAVKEVFPEKVAHYFCGWHMQQNVKRFGKTSADMLWRLLTARTLEKYNELKVGAQDSHPLLTTYLYGLSPVAAGPGPNPTPPAGFRIRRRNVQQTHRTRATANNIAAEAAEARRRARQAQSQRSGRRQRQGGPGRPTPNAAAAGPSAAPRPSTAPSPAAATRTSAAHATSGGRGPSAAPRPSAEPHPSTAPSPAAATRPAAAHASSATPSPPAAPGPSAAPRSYTAPSPPSSTRPAVAHASSATPCPPAVPGPPAASGPSTAPSPASGPPASFESACPSAASGQSAAPPPSAAQSRASATHPSAAPASSAAPCPPAVPRPTATPRPATMEGPSATPSPSTPPSCRNNRTIFFPAGATTTATFYTGWRGTASCFNFGIIVMRVTVPGVAPPTEAPTRDPPPTAAPARQPPPTAAPARQPPPTAAATRDPPPPNVDPGTPLGTTNEATPSVVEDEATVVEEGSLEDGEDGVRVRTGLRGDCTARRNRIWVYEKQWARCAAPTRRFGIYMSNMAESTNGAVKSIHRVPPAYLLASMWDYNVKKFHERREEAKARDDYFTEWGRKRYEKCEQAKNYEVKISNIEFFAEVINNGNASDPTPRSFNVDLRGEGSCECGNWKEYAFPCAHAMAYFPMANKNGWEYVSDCYTTVNLRVTYSHTIPGTCINTLMAQTTPVPQGVCDAPTFTRRGPAVPLPTGAEMLRQRTIAAEPAWGVTTTQRHAPRSMGPTGLRVVCTTR
ncbi:unnamed protein product [Closterium sp. Yama58-4]|nr:unnamed protein product [Closterium sp. Yama58-4]